MMSNSIMFASCPTLQLVTRLACRGIMAVEVNMVEYTTSQIAALGGVHPNTVRLYEKWGLLPTAERRSNNYRVFTERHAAQMRLVRTAFHVELLQSGLRREAVAAVKASAAGNLDEALDLARRYLEDIRQEKRTALGARTICRSWLGAAPKEDGVLLTRSEAAAAAGTTINAVRNWEMNGLLCVRRRQNGYRMYTGEDVRTLRVIRTLRTASYSLSAILRMFRARAAGADAMGALDTPDPDDDIVSACDRLISSLSEAETDAKAMIEAITAMRDLAQPST